MGPHEVGAEAPGLVPTMLDTRSVAPLSRSSTYSYIERHEITML